MKKYVPIIIGVVALLAVVYVGDREMRKDNDITKEEMSEEISLDEKTFRGKVVRMYEGENVLEYGFDLPETATATLEKDGALIKVMEDKALVLAMYTSYEGGRGYSSEDYINNTIKASVPSISMVGTTTIGSYQWTVVESARSVWHVAQAGSWLLVVENTKDNSEKAIAILESVVAKEPKMVMEESVETAPSDSETESVEVIEEPQQ